MYHTTSYHNYYSER